MFCLAPHNPVKCYLLAGNPLKEKIMISKKSKHTKKVFNNKTRKCLVVDDDVILVKGIAEILVSHFNHEAHCITFKGNSNELFEQLYRDYYDILILGIMMPGINGLDLTKRIRIQRLSIPIILMTGNNTPIRAIESMRSGADDLLIKPFLFEELNLSIDNVINQGCKRSTKYNPEINTRGRFEDSSFIKSHNFTGLIKEYYETEELMAELNYKNGKLNGISKVYRKWGATLAEVSFRNGLAHGKTKWFSADGQVCIVDNYENNKTLGRITYDSKGRVKMSIDY